MARSSGSLTKGLSPKQRKVVLDARKYARKTLQAIQRRGGETYCEHGIEVAATLREVTSDPNLLSTMILHDILVHPDGKEFLKHAPLTEDQKELVERMYALRRLHIDDSIQDLDTVIEAFSEDERILPLRMAHRVNDVRHLDRFSASLRRTICKETLHMYTAIAGRLGMHAWRNEMENVCFQFLHPRIVYNLQEQFDAYRERDTKYLKHAVRYLKTKLQKARISCATETRIKGIYSTYRKIILKKRRFEELTDRLAIRIIVDSVDECYRALGVIHAHMHPIPGKLKDYIGAPKENGYQSIHTVVYPLPGVSELPMEIQIRTAHMHRECEYGFLSHGNYKNAVYTLSSNSSRVNLFRNLESLRMEAASPQKFEEVLRTYFREDHVAVFDNHSQLFHLKQPASVLDFACTSAPKRIARLKSVLVNGRAQPLNTLLRDGDTVEVQYSRKRMLQKDWKEACKHKSSRKLISTMTKSTW